MRTCPLKKAASLIGFLAIFFGFFNPVSVLAVSYVDSEMGCFSQPYGDGSFCLLTEGNLREGLLLPKQTPSSLDFLSALQAYLENTTESPYYYFLNQSTNIFMIQREVDAWALETYQRYYAGYVAGGSNSLIPSNAYNGYQVTQDFLQAGVYTLYGARSDSTQNSGVYAVGQYDPLDLVIPMSTTQSVNNYLDANSSSNNAMQAFGITSRSLNPEFENLNNLNLLINYMIPMLRSCHRTFKPFSMQSTCTQTIYYPDTNETMVQKFDNVTPLQPNQVPRGSKTPPAPDGSSGASQAASQTNPTILLDSVAADGTITKGSPLGCSMQSADINDLTNGMQSMISYISYYKDYLQSGDIEKYFASDYPTTHTYQTKKEAMVCLSGLLEGLVEFKGVWTSFKNSRTFAPPNAQETYCQSLLNLPDSSDKTVLINLLDQMIPASETDQSFLVTDPSPGIMASLVIIMYKFQFQLLAQIGLVASQNSLDAVTESMANTSSNGAILLQSGYPTLPFLTMRSEPQSESCSYAPMSEKSRPSDGEGVEKNDSSDPEYLSQALKMSLVEAITSVDQGLPMPGYQVELPMPQTYTLSSGTQVLDNNQFIFVKNGRIMRYAQYSPNFMGVVTSSSTTQRGVSFLNEKFAAYVGVQQRASKAEVNKTINSFNAAKARNAMQRAMVASALESAIKYSVLRQKISSAKSSSSSSSSSSTPSPTTPISSGSTADNICRYSFDDHVNLQSNWRVAAPNQYLAKALDLHNSEGTMSYSDMLEQSQKVDLVRDIVYNLAWQLYMGQKKYELQEYQIALKATQLVLTQQPTIDAASSSGVSTNDNNVWKFYKGAGTAPSAIEGGDPATSAADADPGISPEQQSLPSYPANEVCPNVSPSTYTANEADFIR